MKNKISNHPHRYPMVIQSELPEDDKRYHLAEQVRYAFDGLTKNLFDHLHVFNEPFNDKVVIFKIVDSSFIGLCVGYEFDFLSTSVFQYNSDQKEPWDLSIDEIDGGFGCDMSVTAKTPRQCVMAMIQERKNFLKKSLKSMNKFKNFQNYTKMTHSCC